MNKKQFLSKLDKELKKIESEDKKSILDFYNDFIDDSVNENKSEEEVIENLGSIDKIVNKIKSEYHLKKFDDQPRIGNLLMAITSLFRRIPFGESFKTSINIVTKLVGFIIGTALLYVGEIIVFLVGITLGLVFLYSSVIIQDMSFGPTNIIIICLSILVKLLIIPIISLALIFLIKKMTKLFINFFRKSKRQIEKNFIILTFLVAVAGLLAITYVILQSNIFNSIFSNVSSSLVYVEAISIIIFGLTGILTYLIFIFSRYINNNISKSLNKILKKLEGEKI